MSPLNLMKASGIIEEMCFPKLMKVMRKFRITCMDGEWCLNEAARKRREILNKLGLPLL